MVKLSTMPKAAAAELLMFLADREPFTSVSDELKGAITVEESRALLRELARELAREAGEEPGDDTFQVKGSRQLSRQAKDVISFLSPREEKRLLAAFGLVEEMGMVRK